MARRRLILRHKFALGDSVLLTALTRDIQRAYPNQYEVLVDTHVTEVFDNNPFARKVTAHDYKDGVPETTVRISYRNGIAAAGRGTKVHMLAWYHRSFAEQTGIDVPVTEAKGDLHLTDKEKVPLVSGRYWVVIAGGKMDITCKWWPPSAYQSVVDQLAAQGIRVAQVGARFSGHQHPKLSNVVDLVGQFPSARDMFNLIYNADGVICPVTGAMHIAACFEKPCVVISGGREEPWWENYSQAYSAFGPSCKPLKVEHRFLHTLGLLDCCKHKGCWMHRTQPTGDRMAFDLKLCKLPVIRPDFATPKCMDMVTPSHVLESVMSYYARGEIPPIGALPPKAEPKNGDSPGVVRLPGFTYVDTKIPIQKTDLRSDDLSKFPQATVDVVVTDAKARVDRQMLMNPIDREQENERNRKPVLMEHPLIGGRFTVFVLCYGDHFDLARSCIASITSTLPASCLDLRVALNAPCQATLDYAFNLNKTGVISVLYADSANAKKYPVMRKMFHDPEHPITTPYVVWFDDDAKVIDPGMWSRLNETIVANHPHGGRLYGSVFTHDIAMYAKDGHDPKKWFTSAPWWKGRDMRVRGRGMEAPNGSVLEFVSGWFWSMSTDMIREAGIPDARLNHNGGDIVLGEMVHQAGGTIVKFNPQKSMIWCPSKENGGRRGFWEDFLWCKPR